MKVSWQRVAPAVACLGLALADAGPAAAQSRLQWKADRTIVGAGVSVIPRFEGSDRSRLLPLPVLNVKRGRFVATLADGIGLLAVDEENVAVGASVALVGGYRRRDVPAGIDRVRFSPGARIFSRVRLGDATLTVGGTRALGGTEGVIVDATVSYPVPISQRLLLAPTLATSWANRRHMDRYFGISADESARSGLARYRAGAGFKNATASVTGNYQLDRRIGLNGSVGVSRVLGDAANSPLNERKWTPAAFLGVAYRF